MNTPPKGWFRCRNLSGAKSLGFHCVRCRLVIFRGITDRGVHHCGAWEKPPLIQRTLPVYQIPLPARDGFVGNIGGVSGALVGFD